MNTVQDYITLETRRQFFRKSAAGLGGAALASLLGQDSVLGAAGAASTGGTFHHTPKAKRAIYLFMSGAPSQIDLWDHKPKMDALYDKDLPQEIRNGQRLTTMTSGQARFPVAPSIYQFQKHGQAGTEVSELLPYTAKMVDDIAVIRSMWTEAINHDPAITYIQTGNQIPGNPSLGAWLSYGLGSENENLPSFVVLNSTWSSKRDAQALYQRLWGAGFLPSRHQGVALRAQGDPVLYLSDPKGVSRDVRRTMLDGLNEMAFRMQASVPELTDLSDEPQYILDMYGPDVTKPGTFAYNCLLARRMAERGVRFTQIFHRGWDQHGNLTGDLPLQCGDVDQPSQALVTDLKMRGMLDDTLVVWGGEFGRTIYCQGGLSKTNYGRDHHPRCFTVWLAGAGVKGGTVYGQTDDYSYNIIENPVHIRDLNATILHLLGINHERLSVKHQGLDVRLTGVEKAHVVQGILS
jgi:hypothetical protein